MPRYKIVLDSPQRPYKRRSDTARWVDIQEEEMYYRGERGQFQRGDFTAARCNKCYRFSYTPFIWYRTLHRYCPHCGRRMMNYKD